jgi:uncharacterized glyoxalase superfamily protein PhnB
MKIVGYEPCFRLLNVDRSVAHYQRLGFETEHDDESYAFAHRDHLTINLAHDDDDPTHHVGMLYIHVDDAAELAEQWRKAGVEVTGPTDYDYGKREGSHTDPVGNLIRFGSPDG